MQRRLIWLLAAVMMLLGGLAACQSATSEATATSTSTVAVVARATETSVPTATATPVPQATKQAQESGSKPQPTPTVEWQIPRIGEKEWGKGNPQAGLVLVEYSDFQ